LSRIAAIKKRLSKIHGIGKSSKRIKLFLRYTLLKTVTIVKEVNENDCKTFPIIIVSFNQLFYLKKLISYLRSRNYNNIIILDNASTYPPLIEYFKEIENQVTIHRLKNNYGHLVFWKKKEIFKLYCGNYYVVTDPDIVPDENCPDDFLKYFKNLLNRNPEFTKVGFGLKIEEIPETNPNKEKILNWEKKFWKEQDKDGNYIAEIDTTFALYRPGLIRRGTFYKGLRTKSPYLATHGGWKVDPNQLSEEQLYYLKTANTSSSWKTDKDGNLISPRYDNSTTD
jgi:hypothetical protein